MPTDEDLIQALIEGVIEQQSEPTEVDQDFEISSGGAVSASGGSYISADGADMSNSTSVVYLTVIPPNVAEEAVHRLEDLKRKVDDPETNQVTITDHYRWFKTEIPMVASVLTIMESVSEVVPSLG